MPICQKKMFQRFKSFVLSLSREFSLQLTIDNSFISIESLIHLHKKLLQNAFALEMTVTIIIIDQYASEEHFSYSSEFSSAFKKKKTNNLYAVDSTDMGKSYSLCLLCTCIYINRRVINTVKYYQYDYTFLQYS